MSRALYGGDAASFVYYTSGSSIVTRSATVTLWSAAVGGTRITDLRDMANNPISSVTSATNGLIAQFQGPDSAGAQSAYSGGVPLWADAGGGARVEIFGQLDSRYAPAPSGTPDGTKFYADNGTWKTPSRTIVSVKDYGAIGDGSVDDTAAIQNALNATSSSGGMGVFVPPGVYMVSSPLTMSGGAMLLGAGMGASILRATATFNAAYIVGNASTSLHWEMTVADLQIDGNKAAGALVTHGLFFYGGSDSIVQRVRVVNCSSNGITLDGSNTYLGTATKIVDCFVRSCGGIGVNNQANATDTMIQGSDVGQCTSHAIYIGASNCSLVGSIGWGSNVGLFIDSTVTVLWCSGSRFDNNNQQGIYSKGSEVLIDGTFVHDNSHNSTGTIAGIKIDTGAGKHLLSGVRSAGGLISGQTQQSYGLELGANRTALTTVRGCDLSGNATAGLGGDTTNLLVAQTLGVNPAGYLGSPAVPASGTAYTNTYPYDCTVYLHGGTISAISVNGSSITTFFDIPPVRVPRGGTITLTYTGTPQWDWFDN